MLNVHDEAHNLAKALKESKEYQAFNQAKEALEKEPDKMKIAQDYMRKQMEIQSLQMMGHELTKEQVTSYNALANTIMGIPVVAQYFQAQVQFSIVFQEITDIIAKAVDLDMGLFDEEADHA